MEPNGEPAAGPSSRLPFYDLSAYLPPPNPAGQPPTTAAAPLMGLQQLSASVGLPPKRR